MSGSFCCPSTIYQIVSGTGGCIFRFSICFQAFWDKTGLSNKFASLFTRGVFSKIKNVYEEAKVIIEIVIVIEVVFFIVFKPDYRDLIQKHKTANKLTVISKVYYISKLLAELGLSNSNCKTNSKATHFIEEIIPPNISYC